MLYYVRYLLYVILLFVGLFCLIPFVIIRPLSSKNNTAFFKIFKWIMETSGLFKLHIEGEEILKDNFPCILAGNHQHNFDVLTVADLFKNNVAVLGKYELGFLPFFGQIYVLCGNILIKRGNRKKAMASMDLLVKKIKEKSLGILIFPEGTRNPAKELKPFKKGAFHTAVRSQIPIIPFSASQFVAYCDLNSLKRIHIYIKVHPPIPTVGLTNKDIPALMEETRIAIQSGIEEVNKNYQ